MYNNDNDDTEYDIMVEAAKRDPACYIPESWIFHTVVANTPTFIRRYFEAKGRRK